MNKALKVTISGSFHIASKQVGSFDNVIGIIPAVDEDKATQMVIKRYAKMWIEAAKNKDGERKYAHVQAPRKVYVGSIEEIEREKPFSYVGKDIMKMDMWELQDLATACDLRAIPLPSASDVVFARRVAFSEYAIKVLGLEEYADNDEQQKFNLYDWRTNGFNPLKFEAIIADDEIRRHDGGGKEVVSVEEEFSGKRKAAPGKRKADAAQASSQSKMTFAQLKQVAKSRGVLFNPGMSFDALYKKVYGVAA